MIVFKPSPKFEAIAISRCELCCTHCNRRYLNQMKKKVMPKELLEYSYQYNGNGFLISGGFDKKGKLNALPEFASTLSLIKKSFYIAIHLGFDDENNPIDVKSICDIAFVDIPINKAIKSVYKLPYSTDDYIKNMERLLEHNIPVSPHITLGLDNGKIKDEYHLIDKIKRYKIEKLVVNMVVPTKNTAFETVTLDRQEVVNFIDEIISTKIPFAIGCMRPRLYDIDLVDNGVDEIANPTKKALSYAEKELGKEIEKQEWCCGINIKKIFNKTINE